MLYVIGFVIGFAVMFVLVSALKLIAGAALTAGGLVIGTIAGVMEGLLGSHDGR